MFDPIDDSVPVTIHPTTSSVRAVFTAIKNNFLALVSSIGASLVGYLPSGTGAVATTVQTKLRESVSVFDFMTAQQKADVISLTGSDVTTAWQAAIDHIKTFGNTTSGKPKIDAGFGYHKLSNLTLSSMQGLTIEGQGGESGTYLDFIGTGVLFEFDTFDSTPANLYIGTCSGTTFKNLIIKNNAEIDIANTGSRTSTAIKNNGSSRFTFDNVKIYGFQYGYSTPYGGYLTKFKNSCVLQLNDVGAYFGPGSQLSDLGDTRFIENGEGVVNEMSAIMTFNKSDFEDQMTSDVTILGRDTTRYSVATSLGKVYEYNLNMYDCWHETGSWGTNWNPHTHILLDGDASNPIRNININTPHIISGTNGMAAKTGGVTYSFIESNYGIFINLIKPVIANARLDTFINNVQEGSSFIDRSREINGYSAITQFSGSDNSSVSIDWNDTKTVDFNNYNLGFYDQGGTHKVRITPKVNGMIGMSFYTGGSWYERLIFDIQNSAVLLGGTILVTRGGGSPEGSRTAPIGSLYLRTDGGAGTCLYIKESGTGNTGWVAK